MANLQKTLFRPWFGILTLATISVYLYVFMEWLFFITKPSFMSAMNFLQRLEVFLVSSFILALPGLCILLFISIFDLLIHRQNVTRLLTTIGIAIPAGIFAALGFILIDNFTYTIFGFGVVSTEGIWRITYALLFLILFAVVYKNMSRLMGLRGEHEDRLSKPQAFLALSLLLISTILIVIKFLGSHVDRIGEMSNFGTLESSPPNIILLGGDGLNANHMSIYGYERDTTPNIRNLAKSALVAENAFPNGGNTGGSLASILTGKLPTETRVIYPPDILTGVDSYQHLPGILRQLGYHTVQITSAFYGDAYVMNFQNGFDVVNLRSENENPQFDIAPYLGEGSSTYFAGTILERIAERIQHAFYIKTFSNPYKLVMEPTADLSEEKRIDTLLSLLDESKGPLFIHVHMQGTHGPLFNPREQTFSIGQVQDKKWMTDFYDDAILDFDRQVGQVFEHLSQAGMLDNTIIIIYSDHGFEWQTRNRIPLIIWFPKGEHAGIIKNNVQNLDIVPTILDYLGIPQPEWLSGRSLLSQGEPPVDRYILAASTTGELVAVTESRGWALSEDKIAPPFYQLGYVSLIVCNRWYELYFIHPRLLYGEVQGHTAPCDANNLPTTDYAKSIILNHLADNDYNVSSFPKDISITPAATTVPTVSATVVTPPTTTAIPPTTIPSPVSITWEYPTTGWNPLIAHGFGQWHGKYSPNNYEAFLESLAEGYRTFEVDILMSSDGIPLAAHDRQEWEYYGLSGVFSDYTAEQFLATKLDGVGTTMAGPQILQLLKDYPDVRIVLDVKVSDQTTAIIWFLDRLPMSQWPRLLTNIRTEQQIQNLYAKYPSYRGAFLAVNAWREDLVFSDEDVKDIVMQYDLAGVFTWVNELDYSLDYLANNAAHRRWSPTLERYMIEAGKAMIWHTTDDPALIALRRSAGGAVITDTATPEPHPLRVLIISIDGFRPEAIFQAPMPNLMALMQTSAYTLSAQTIYPSFTLPSHVTMLTGLCPSQHGVVWNDYFPDRGYAVGIDIFDLADAAGMRTFMVVGKLKLRQITEPESTDIFEFINDRDTVIAARVAKLIPQGFDLMFVHFPTPDLIGHEYGWLSPEQLSVLYRSDEALGTILSALDEAGLREDTLIIITADHGGHNTTHGTNRPDDMTIPWIIFGPGVVPIQLTTAVNTTDTAATAAWALNLPIPLEWDGRPVLEAFGLLDEPHPQPRCP